MESRGWRVVYQIDCTCLIIILADGGCHIENGLQHPQRPKDVTSNGPSEGLSPPAKASLLPK